MTVTEKMNTRDNLNRCHPGFGASCALCCGSHNYLLSPEEIDDLFLERGQREHDFPCRHPETILEPRLIADAMQCPNVGTISQESGTIGCLCYRSPEKRSAFADFFRGTCKNFYCPAWSDLTDRQVLFAAALLRDWYFYSLLINDMETLQELYAAYERPENVPDEVLAEVKETILARMIEEDGK